MTGRRRIAAPLFSAALATILLGGCGNALSPDALGSPDGAAAPAAPPTPPDPASVQANELGLVPVLMYHRLVDEPVSVYDRSPDDFRSELERLARENYVPITTQEYATGRIDIPAGAHPVVLTFDDGDPSTISLDSSGNPASGTAVAILQEVAAAHPGFRPVASLYVNADPFGGGDAGERAMRWLVEHGFELGNHTAGHTNLRTASASKADAAITDGEQVITDVTPDHAPRTLSLPFGARPQDDSLISTGADGYAGVLLVGANPAPSPFSTDFDAAAIPRIRSQGAEGKEADFGSTSWLDQLAAAPATRYTSDGDPNRIAYPSTAGTDAAPVPADGMTTLRY